MLILEDWFGNLYLIKTTGRGINSTCRMQEKLQSCDEDKIRFTRIGLHSMRTQWF